MNTPRQKNTFTEKNKRVVIAIFAVILIVIIVFIGRQLVGKAIYVPLPSGFTAGAEFPVDLPKTGGDIVTVTVSTKFDPLWESVAYGFELQYDPAILEFVDVDSKLAGDWGTDFVRQGIIPDAAGLKTLKFEHATIDFASAIDVTEAQLVRLADVNFKVLKPEINTFADLGTLQFSNIDVLSLDATNPVDYTEGWVYVQPTGKVVITMAAGEAWFISYAEKERLCRDAGLTAVDCPLTTGYNADLTLDGKFDGQDAQVIFGTRDARNDPACGSSGENPCNYDKLYVCDDGSFRVQGLVIYNGGVPYSFASETCNYGMEAGP